MSNMSSMLPTTAAMPPFHLAFPVHDIAAARQFYGDLLGCPEGRSSPEWIDFNFYGHQIVAHLAPDECGRRGASSKVDDHDVPVRTTVPGRSAASRATSSGSGRRNTTTTRPAASIKPPKRTTPTEPYLSA